MEFSDEYEDPLTPDFSDFNSKYQIFNSDNSSFYSSSSQDSNYSENNSLIITSNIDQYTRDISEDIVMPVRTPDEEEIQINDEESCVKCKKYKPKIGLFGYKKVDFICLNCAVNVKREDISDWEEKHKKGKGLIKCTHCHGYKSECRYPIKDREYNNKKNKKNKKTNKRRKICDYCSLICKLRIKSRVKTTKRNN